MKSAKNPSRIVIYTTEYCNDCLRAKKILEASGVEFEQIRLEDTPGAADFVIRANGGFQSVPTIVFPDGSILVEPAMEELKIKILSLK